MRISEAVVALLLLASFASAESSAYRPGFYRLAATAGFVGRIHIDSAIAAVSDDGTHCGIVHEATVVEGITKAGAGSKVRFVAQIEPGAWSPGGDYFAMLFPHAIEGGDRSDECWLAAAPLFAAASPASVIAFDGEASGSLGGEFLRISSDNVLAGLRFAAIEYWTDGVGGQFASWELIRAYARQSTAAVRALPSLPESPNTALTPRLPID